MPGLNCGAGEERGGADREDSRDREAADLQQSRSDKWKAKHEAMLKLAASPLSLNDNTKSGKNEPSNAEEEMKLKQQILEKITFCVQRQPVMAEAHPHLGRF